MLDKWLIHYTAARAVRLGYNVLAVDADTLPLGDFYGLMKSPPYSGVQLWNQREGNFNVNGGFYYVHNASTSGPVAFLLYDNLLKNARWYADARPLRAAVGLPPNDTSTGIVDGFLCNDQFSLSDAVHSAVTGKPQVLECLFYHTRNPTERSAWEAPHLQLYRTTGPRGPQQLGPYEVTPFPVPPPLRLGSGGAATADVTTALLHVPHGRGDWPPERGGLPFAPGPLPDMAAALRDLFREGGRGQGPPGEQPLQQPLQRQQLLPDFPDPYNPADQAAAAAVPPERFAYLPPWMLNTWGWAPGANAGVEGHYNTHLTGRLPALVSHLHAGLTPGDFNKQVHLAVGVPRGWSLDMGGAAAGGAAVAAEVTATAGATALGPEGAVGAVGASDLTGSAAGARAALAARGSGGARRVGRRRRMLAAAAAAPYAYLGTAEAAGGGMPPLLALAPGVVRPDMGAAEFTALMQGLMRLGLAVGRAVVWPWVPCEVPFLRRVGATYDPAVSGHKIPWSDYLNVSAAIPNGPGSADLRRDGLRCLLAALDKLACLRGGVEPPGPSPTAPRGLLPHEFDHWLAGAEAGASRRRRDRQRLLQQEAALATGRRVRSHAHAPHMSPAVSAAEAGGAGESAELDLEVPLLPTPMNTIQDILERRGGSRATGPPDTGSSTGGDSGGGGGGRAVAVPPPPPPLVLTPADLLLLRGDPAVSGRAALEAEARRTLQGRNQSGDGGGTGDEGEHEDEDEAYADESEEGEGNDPGAKGAREQRSSGAISHVGRHSSSSSSSGKRSAVRTAAAAAAAAGAPAAVLWLRGPVSVPQLPSAALEAFYSQQVEPLCCVLLGWPTAPDCMWRSPAAQSAMAASAAAAATYAAARAA